MHKNEKVAGNGRVPVVEKPTFDFSRVSWKEAKQWALEALYVGTEEGETDPAKIEEGWGINERAIARVLVSVPRSWLVPDAPEGLDWSNPESLGWLIGVKMEALRRAMQEAQQEEAGK